MPNTTIYLVRHAEAEGNLYRLAHGPYNSNITAKGYRQLSWLKKRFADIHIDAVCGSDLFRAKTTASTVYVPKALPYFATPLLREIDKGDWDILPWEYVRHFYPEQFHNFFREPGKFRAPGGETYRDLLERWKKGMQEIVRAHAGKTVAVFGHGAGIRVFMSWLKGVSVEEMSDESTFGENTSVTLLSFRDDSADIVYESDGSHLPDELCGHYIRRPSLVKKNAQPPLRVWYSDAEETERSLSAAVRLEDDKAGELGAEIAADGQAVVTKYFVDEAVRRRSIGTQMMGQIVQFARKKGADRITVSAPPEVSGFFRSIGFVPVPGGPEGLLMQDISHTILPIPYPAE